MYLNQDFYFYNLVYWLTNLQSKDESQRVREKVTDKQYMSLSSVCGIGKEKYDYNFETRSKAFFWTGLLSYYLVCGV